MITCPAMELFVFGLLLGVSIGFWAGVVGKH